MSTRYKAFLSYCHADEAVAQWLQTRLERWRVPKDLAGTSGRHGPVPRKLSPIFRDRDDFAGGASLKAETLHALEASDFLIVVCSPAAAASAYVNEEIRAFKAMNKADRVLPIIVAGEPHAGDGDCFPEALKYAVDAHGELTGERVEPLAADARDSGDGKARAVAKLAAGLLGVPFDDVIRRAERYRRWRTALLAGVGTGAVVFAAALSAFALIQSQRAQAALERSVFALGGAIQQIDELDAGADIDAEKDSLLSNQCDLLDGLARFSGQSGPIEQTLCRLHRAAAAAARDELDAALADLDAWYRRLADVSEPMAGAPRDRVMARVMLRVRRLRLLDGAGRALSDGDLRAVLDEARRARERYPDTGYFKAVDEHFARFVEAAP